MHTDRLFETLLPILALLVALMIGAIMLLLLGVNPLEAYGAMISGTFGRLSGLTQIVVKATPLLLVGLGIVIAFRADVINIGGEGQLIMGALSATAFALTLRNAPFIILIPFTLLAGLIGGSIWGGIAGILKARLNVNEILSTIMMNGIALQLMNFLLSGPMLDPKQIEAGTLIAESEQIPAAAWLPRLVPRTQMHAGILIALALALVVYILLWRTTIGYRIRAVGLNLHAARYAGMPVQRYQALSLALSGALAGLAGAVEVMGLHHRTLEGISAGYGFSGIVVALFGKLHPITSIPAALLFGALYVGADNMQRAVQIPDALVDTLLGLIVIFVVSSEFWVRQRARKRVEVNNE